MKYRYLIEASGDEFWPYHLATVDARGESTSSLGDYDSIEVAKARAEAMAQSGDEETWGEKIAIVWKDPPKAWQPDAICVSQVLEEMYPDLPV